jgi:DNA gyrase subunit A
VANRQKPPKSPKRTRRRTDGDGSLDLFRHENAPQSVALHEVAQTRYLNYALSVITSRALPDVRDGLKPVQRRILYTMWQQHLHSDAKPRKCAKVVGDVMGNYHPHGDAAIYDALVRIAQPFSLRVPLVQGSGNFGSLDGDPAAAMRYTECKLAVIAGILLAELGQDTVHFRANYDGTRTEPVVLPARFPQLLVNGASGIAVGMATSIPPHNLEEVCAAAIRLLDALVAGKELSSRELCRTIKGPDFPTGGQVVSSPDELKQIYEAGQGTIKIRGTWKVQEESKNQKIITLTSIPYNVNKATLVERIADIVTSRQMPLLLDVRDLSTDDVRIELSLKKEADEQKVMAYLFKHTPLQSTFSVNMTCLVPTETPEIGRPERLDLQAMLWHFLHFRLDVVTRRLEHELAELKRRMHILEGFVAVFDALDAILAIIRKSEGKQDAAAKIIARFKLDAEQTDAILELKLYRLARLEILVIQKELAEKRKRTKEISKLLSDEQSRGIWDIVREELDEVIRLHAKGDKRRTLITAIDAEQEYSAEDLIVAEDNHVLLTRDGWVKRQKEIKDPAATRLREGDQVLACLAGSTRATAAFFSNFGSVYTTRIIDIPATTGYGEPIQKLFKLRDGEAVVAAVSLDSRAIGNIAERDGKTPEFYAIAATSDGFALAFGLSAFIEPSTRAGRRYAKLTEGCSVVGVEWAVARRKPRAICISRKSRVLVCAASEISYLSGPGRGVVLMKLDDGDQLLGIKVANDPEDALLVKTTLGGEQKITLARHDTSARGGKGRDLIKRGQISEVLLPTPVAPQLSDPKGT